MTKNFRKFTIHMGEPRNAAALSFHNKGSLVSAWRVKMYGLGHPSIGFIGFVRFIEKLRD